MTRIDVDILVIGSGIAGLSFALRMAEQASVAVVTKKERANSNTNYARGGIAAVLSPDDSFELHTRDTLSAGAGLCHPTAVDALVREGPGRVRELIEWGANFTSGNAGLALGREGGHSRRRIVHAADLTGREIERALIAAVADHPSVQVFEDHLALDLLISPAFGPFTHRCAGALALNHVAHELAEFRSHYTFLATGGVGRAFRHTTNPEIATGDGVAMAYRAGAEVANLEFVQFHPTALFPTEDRAVLISEAVRGEGAVLRGRDGVPLLEGVHLGSLATRDVVARAIDARLKESGDEFVLLDLSPIPPETIAERFPNIFEECEARGLDIRREPIPVVPAAHYSCGGVRTDYFGRTTVPALFAAGEVACTGVHGANRLASNSLLEALVFSARAAQEMHRGLERRRARGIPVSGMDARPVAVPTGPAPGALDEGDAAAQVGELRALMWEDAGIVRSAERLARAEERLRDLRHETEIAYVTGPLKTETAELRNLAQAAHLIVRCALEREESRGLHFNIDYPHRDNERYLRDTILGPEDA